MLLYICPHATVGIDVHSLLLRGHNSKLKEASLSTRMQHLLEKALTELFLLMHLLRKALTKLFLRPQQPVA